MSGEVERALVGQDVALRDLVDARAGRRGRTPGAGRAARPRSGSASDAPEVLQRELGVDGHERGHPRGRPRRPGRRSRTRAAGRSARAAASARAARRGSVSPRPPRTLGDAAPARARCEVLADARPRAGSTSPSLPRLPCTSSPPGRRGPGARPWSTGWPGSASSRPGAAAPLRRSRLELGGDAEPELADLVLDARVELAQVLDERGLPGPGLRPRPPRCSALEEPEPWPRPGAPRLASSSSICRRARPRQPRDQRQRATRSRPQRPRRAGQMRGRSKRADSSRARHRPRQWRQTGRRPHGAHTTASRRSRQSPDMRLWQSAKSYFTGSSGSSARSRCRDLLGHPPVAACAAA